MQTPGPYLYRGEVSRQHGGFGFDPDAYPRPSAAVEGVDVLLRFWRRKKLIALSITGALALGLVASVLMTPRFSSEAQIMVGMDPVRVTKMENVVQQTVADLETVQTAGYVVQSRDVAARVANRLALDKDPEFNPFLRNDPIWRRAVHWVTGGIMGGFRWLMGQSSAPSARAGASKEELGRIEQEVVTSVLLSHVDVMPLSKSHVLSITADSENPVTASRIANAFADVYVEQQLVGKTEAAKTATGVLTQQIGELRQRVEESERAVEEYKRANGLYQAKSTNVTEQQLSELNSQLILSESSQAEVEARLRQAEAAQRSPNGVNALPDVLRSPLIHSLRDKQAEMERMKAEMTSTYGARHPKMQEVEAQARDVQNAVKSEIGNIVAGLKHETQAARAHRRPSWQPRPHQAGYGRDQFRFDQVARTGTRGRGQPDDPVQLPRTLEGDPRAGEHGRFRSSVDFARRHTFVAQLSAHQHHSGRGRHDRHGRGRVRGTHDRGARSYVPHAPTGGGAYRPAHPCPGAGS
jgi:uncharacterized protein involved in exopolysaccharide biosynthesis